MCYIVQVNVVLVSNIYIGIKLYRTIVVIQAISRDIDRYRIKLYLLITVRLHSWLIVKLDGNTADVQLVIRSIVLWLISALVLLLGSRFTLLSLLLQFPLSLITRKVLLHISFELLVASKRKKDNDEDAKEEIDESRLEILVVSIIEGHTIKIFGAIPSVVLIRGLACWIKSVFILFTIIFGHIYIDVI